MHISRVIFALFFGVVLLANANAQQVSPELIITSLVEDGKSIRLELLISKPRGIGPFPVVIFNHGSTGRGDKPELFRRSWISGSDGLYDEGFETDRSRYSCLIDLSLSGAKRAFADLDAVVEHVQLRPDVLSKKMLIGGQSRGGILAIAYAGAHPDIFLGAINFVGGWIGEKCSNAKTINGTIFKQGSPFKQPTLWLYGERDPYYSLSHSKSNFDAFVGAGGNGSFKSYSIPGSWIPGNMNGHDVILYPDLWSGLLDSYVDALK